MTRARRGRPVGSKNGDGVAVPLDFHAWPSAGSWCVRIGRQPGVKRGVELSVLTPCLATIVDGVPMLIGNGVVRKRGKTISVTP